MRITIHGQLRAVIGLPDCQQIIEIAFNHHRETTAEQTVSGDIGFGIGVPAGGDIVIADRDHQPGRR